LQTFPTSEVFRALRIYKNVRVLREAKAATHRIFDPATKQLIEVPDHKKRFIVRADES
jgi:hypothetical protein